MSILHGPFTCDKGLLKFKKLEKFKQSLKSSNWFFVFPLIRSEIFEYD
jgi:hypothetical protein